MAKNALLATLAVIGVAYLLYWYLQAGRRDKRAPGQAGGAPTPLGLGVGFVTNFFDTLGIGSFATTTAIFRATKTVDDRVIPGTLNVGHALPTITQALIYIAIVQVDLLTLVLLIIAAVLGAWLGAGVVCRWSRRNVQLGMGLALLVAAVLMLGTALKVLPTGGLALELTGTKLIIGLAGNFLLGALMTLGIGLYGPAIIMVSLLGMSPAAAFPIMMGSCAFLMPVGSAQFIRKNSYDLRAAIALAIGGIPGVLIAAYLVVSMPIEAVRWLVVVVVLYTSAMMLRSALTSQPEATAGAPAPQRKPKR